MTYDDWKTESPEDECERLNRRTKAERRALAYETGELDPDIVRDEHEDRTAWEKFQNADQEG